MAEELIVKAEKREAQGTGGARRLRHAGQVPAVVYGDGDPLNIQLNGHDFMMLLRDYGQNFIADLAVEGEKKPRKVLLKDVQHDPRHGQIQHADFIAISMTQLLQVNLPIVLIGDPAGVTEGGTLEQLVSDITVECLPGDMVESITVDVSAMNIGDHLTVSDLAMPEGLKAVTEAEVAVASVAAPRVEEAPAAEGEGEEGAEGEAGEAAAEGGEAESEA